VKKEINNSLSATAEGQYCTCSEGTIQNVCTVQLTHKNSTDKTRGVSSGSSLRWPVGWPHLHLGGGNFGWHNAWLSECGNLTPAMQCHAVNTANV